MGVCVCVTVSYIELFCLELSFSTRAMRWRIRNVCALVLLVHYWRLRGQHIFCCEISRRNGSSVDRDCLEVSFYGGS